MNTIDEIALRVAEKLEPRGRTYSPEHYIEFASALLAELSKDAEPVAWMNPYGGIVSAKYMEQASGLERETYNIQLFTHHLPVEAIEEASVTQKAYYESVFQDGAKRIADEQHKVKVLTKALAHIRLLASFESGRNDAEIHETAREALSTVKGSK